VREPQLFLFDEPIAHLDAKLRAHMRGELKIMQRELGTTMIYVTHDQLEALSMADRIAVMHEGVLQQFGTPREIYDHPVNEWVAGFVGEPPIELRRLPARGPRRHALRGAPAFACR
jgi:multiple sugar transport system ATP-binding protein